MDTTSFVPVIAEATRFFFDQAAKWMEHLRKRGNVAISNHEPPAPVAEVAITKHDFEALDGDVTRLTESMNLEIARTSAYEIRGLVAQLQIHRKNIIDLEIAEAEYGVLAPTHIKRSIERESAAFIEKSVKLRDLLSQVYGRSIDYV